MLVTQALVHRRRLVRLEHVGGALLVLVDNRMGPAAGLKVGELWEPVPDHCRALIPRQRRATRAQPGRLGRSHVLADGFSVRSQALRHHRDGQAGMCFYFYIWDRHLGPGFIKISTYLPYPIKVWLNGHEWAKRQAKTSRIDFSVLPGPGGGRRRRWRD